MTASRACSSTPVHRVTAPTCAIPTTSRRSATSAPIAIGHDAANVGDAEAVVVTGALWQDNPEYQLALQRGLPVLHRSQALAWLIAGQRLVSVAAHTARPRRRA